MKKKTLLVLILLAFAMPWMANADEVNPICEDFSSTTAVSSANAIGSLPSGWDKIYSGYSNGTQSYQPKVYNKTNIIPSGYSGGNYLFMAAAGGNYLSVYGNVVYVILPPYDNVSSVSFNAWKEDETGTLEFGYITNASDATSFQSLETVSSIPVYTSATSSNISFEMDNLSIPSGARLTFKWSYPASTNGGNYLLLDDVCVYKQVQNCDFYADFEDYTATSYNTSNDAVSVDGWDVIYNGESYRPKPHVCNSTANGFGPVNGSNYFLFLGGESGYGYNNYVILPENEGKHPIHIEFNFKYDSDASSSTGTLSLGYITGTNESTFIVLQSVTSGGSAAVQSYATDITNMPAGTRLAFRWAVPSGTYGCSIDDICIRFEEISCSSPTNPSCVTYGETTATLDWVPAGEETSWDIEYAYGDGYQQIGSHAQTVHVNAHPHTLSGLVTGQTYYFHVRAVCDENNHSEWSAVADVTPATKYFLSYTADKSWDNAANWIPSGVPGIGENVAIAGDAEINSGTVATANNITIDAGGSITIKSGGQLQHNNADNNQITVKIEKAITPYQGDDYTQTNKGFDIISFPVNNVTPDEVTGLLSGTHHDLFTFKPTNQVSGNYLEWVHVAEDDEMQLLNGYLYANDDGSTTISVMGQVMSSASDYNRSCTGHQDGGPLFNGWVLLGNPFVCNAYLTASGNHLDFYTIGTVGDHDEFVTFDNSHPIEPMGGVMVYADANDQLTYSRTQPEPSKSGILNMVARKVNSRSEASQLDRARLRFGTGRNLPKLQLNPRHTKVYIPEGAKDYAVYYTEGAGSVPVNFKAEHNGRYMLDFSMEDVSFNYLHLIDNRTGADIDLLATPYYTFDAKSTDYESRFKVVFATGEASNDDNFAFYSNGSWVINNEGDATLQVIDMLGHVLSSERISGAMTKSINAASGIYMLRLINGDNVRVQKVVVR